MVHLGNKAVLFLLCSCFFINSQNITQTSILFLLCAFIIGCLFSYWEGSKGGILFLTALVCLLMPVVCLETAILFETGCDTLCDIIWAVVTDKELRIQRLMESRGYSREKTESIMRVQLSDKEWEKRCDAVLVNNGNLQKLQERIEELLVRKTNL